MQRIQAEVVVGVDEPWHHRCLAKVDEVGVGVPSDQVALADVQDPLAVDHDDLSLGMGRIHGEDALRGQHLHRHL